MDSLRWVLLGLGLLLIVGIYLLEVARRRRRGGGGDLDDADLELLGSLQAARRDSGPEDLTGLESLRADRAGGADVDLDDLDDLRRVVPRDGEEDSEVIAAPRIQTRPPKSRVYTVGPSTAPKGREMIVVLNLMAEPGATFAGPDLLAALESVDMRHGAMQIFHHFGVGELTCSEPVFSAANMLEPGYFDPDHMEDFTTPGLVLFMRLPGPLDPRVAFELMLSTGQRLARELEGELRDETRSLLTLQGIGRLREKIADFGRLQRVAEGVQA